MPKKFRLSFLLLLWQLLTCPALAQKDIEYWFAAPDISNGGNGGNYDRPMRFVFSTYESAATITLSQPANPNFPTRTTALPPNTSGTFDFPPDFQLVETTPANQVVNRGFLLKSDAPISAYYEVLGGINQANPELYSLKGRNALGTLFYVPFQTKLKNSDQYSPTPASSFDIVATEDNTTVAIIPTRDLVGHPANAPFTIILNLGQTFSAQSAGLQGNQHPTGSRVTSDKPIAITMKDDLLEGGLVYGGTCRDQLGDQIVPVDKLGTQYVVQKGMISSAESAFVLATADNTQIRLNGSVISTLNTGEARELAISQPRNFIESTAPIYVLHMSGNGCEVGAEVLPSLECSGSRAVRFIRTNSEPFFMFLVTRKGWETGFKLNGNGSFIPTSSFGDVPGSGGQFVSATISFPTSQVPAGPASIVENSLGVFQMGFLNGREIATGCRYGYFSDFGTRLVVEESISLCTGDTAIVHGIPVFGEGYFYDTIQTANGCDTLREIFVKRSPFTTSTRTVPLCTGEPFFLHGIANFAPSVVFDTVTAQNGCDTLVIYDLVETPSPTQTRTVSLCPGSSFTLNGAVYFAPATVFDTLPATGNGCDTLLILTLEETPLVPKTQTIRLCPGKNLIFNGTTYFPPKTLLDTLPGAMGCDTLLILNLVETPLVPQQKSVGLCPGELYLFDGQLFAAPTILFDTLPATIGCDTMLSIELTEIAPPTLVREVLLCPNEPYEFKGQNFLAPAILFGTLPATIGCDTMLTIELSEIDPPMLTREVLLCPGEVIVIGHKTYWSAGTVLDTLPGNEGCDTIRTTIVEVAESVWPFLQPDTSLCASETVVLVSSLTNTIWNGNIASQTLIVTESGIYTAVATDANGCPARDSVLVSTCCAEAGIFVPNVFSPNGDGHNEEFRAFHNDICIEFTLSVYDRWGELIWRSFDPEAVWDGKFRGKSAPAGVYVWVLEIREGRKTDLKKGNVTLLR